MPDPVIMKVVAAGLAQHPLVAVSTPVPNAIPRAGRKAAGMIPGQRTIGSGAIPDNQCDHIGSYSFCWWTNGIDRKGKRHWSALPTDAYGAFGHGGPRVMLVIPSLEVVMSWNDASVRGRKVENEAFKRLMQAVRKRP